MIPPFDERGNLPSGIHKADWIELDGAFGSSLWRVTLLAGLREALVNLHEAGCRTAYIDGSFVTAKEQPGDFDACWDSAGVNLAVLDRVLLDFSEDRKAQKARFGGELFPADMATEPAGTHILDFFQRDRVSVQPKGIVEIDLETGL
jgi:hypothetical protein